jgi:hypothetical protein
LIIDAQAILWKARFDLVDLEIFQRETPMDKDQVWASLYYGLVLSQDSVVGENIKLRQVIGSGGIAS